MKSRPVQWYVLAVALTVGLPVGAADFKLPSDMPAREEGLWLKETISTVRKGDIAFENQKVWHICLDAKADHALHELELRKQQASVARLSQSCEVPKLIFKGDTLSWIMHCPAASSSLDKIGKTEVQHTTSFLSTTETRSETRLVSRDVPVPEGSRFLTYMKRLGACDSQLKAGGMILMHSRISGEETLKARQRRNVFEDVANIKALAVSRLRR